MKAEVGGIVYFFDEPIEHKRMFWKKVFKHLVSKKLITSFEYSWTWLLKEIE